MGRDIAIDIVELLLAERNDRNCDGDKVSIATYRVLYCFIIHRTCVPLDQDTHGVSKFRRITTHHLDWKTAGEFQ